jgi:hypothetical protein
MARKIIQIIENRETDEKFSSLTCLCDDGSVWVYCDSEAEWSIRTPYNKLPQGGIPDR